MKLMVIALGLSVTCLGAFAQTYRWVDEQGQVHYSSTPPASQKMESEKASVEGGAPKTTAEIAARQIAEEKAKQAAVAENPAEENTVKEDKAKEVADAKQAAYNRAAQAQAQQRQQQLSVACDSMRKDLATYQNQPLIRTNVDGVIRRLTPEELNAKITELKRNIGENCQ